MNEFERRMERSHNLLIPAISAENRQKKNMISRTIRKTVVLSQFKFTTKTRQTTHNGNNERQLSDQQQANDQSKVLGRRR